MILPAHGFFVKSRSCCDEEKPAEAGCSVHRGGSQTRPYEALSCPNRRIHWNPGLSQPSPSGIRTVGAGVHISPLPASNRGATFWRHQLTAPTGRDDGVFG